MNIPLSERRRIEIKLSLDGNVVTGTWLEHTSPSGHYKRAVFYSAIQLIISDDGRQMTGQWLGFNSGRTRINNGKWEFSKR